MMRSVLVLAAAAIAVPAMAQTVRQLGPHVHGVSSLSIAVEGNSVGMVLVSPGADLLGFETAATTDAERAALAQATMLLADPLHLFTVPAAAGCKVDNVDQEIDQVAAAPAATGADAASNVIDRYAAQSTHSDVTVTYMLTCSSPRAISGIDFHLFDAFPNAQVVNVQLVTERGQRAFTVDRAHPHLDLGGAV